MTTQPLHTAGKLHEHRTTGPTGASRVERSAHGAVLTLHAWSDDGRTQLAAARSAVFEASRDGAAWARTTVQLSPGTDGWLHAERDQEQSKALLAMLAAHAPGALRVTTCSPLIGRDAHLLKRIAATADVEVTVPFSGLDLRSWRRLEPTAPSPDRRWLALDLLVRAGVRVGMQLTPLVAAVDGKVEAVRAAVERAASHGAAFVELAPELVEGPRKGASGASLQRLVDAAFEAAERCHIALRVPAGFERQQPARAGQLDLFA